MYKNDSTEYYEYILTLSKHKQTNIELPKNCLRLIQNKSPPSHLLSTNSKPSPQVHEQDPSRFWHIWLEPHTNGSVVHSSMSTSHFSPVHPDRQTHPVASSHLSPPGPHSHTLLQFWPQFGSSQPVKQKKTTERKSNL